MRRRLHVGVVLAIAGVITLAALAVGGAAASAPLPAATAQTASARTASVRHLWVVALPDATWNDLDPRRSPHLARLLDHAAIGSVSLQRITDDLDVADTAATVSAGARSAGGVPACTTRGAVVRCAGFTAIRRDNAARRYGARTGLLGATLARASVGRVVVGTPSDAALAIVEATGSATGQTAVVSPGSTPAVLLVDGPRFHGGASADDATARLDDLLRAVAAASDRAHDAVLLVSFATAPGPKHLGVIALAAPGVRPAGLRSTTTDRDGIVQSADLGPTVLDVFALGVPGAMEGRPAFVVGGITSTERRVAAARSLDDDAVQRDRMLGAATFALAIAPLVLLALALVVHLWWRRPAPWFAALAGWVLAFPVATYLIPVFVDAYAGQIGYWTVGACISILVGTLAAIVAAARHRPIGQGTVSLVGAFGLVVLGADLLRGGVVQYNAVFGYSATVGGRFTGSGNMTTGFLAALLLGVIAALAPVAQRGWRAWWPEIAWVGLTLVVAAPGLGSDVGGALFLVPTGVVLACMRHGVRVRVRTLVGAVLAAVALVAVFVAVDLARPADERTHLARLLGGGGDGAVGLGDVVARKAAMAARSLSHTVWWWGVPAVVLMTATLAWAARGRTRAVAARYPALRACTMATVIGAVLGSLVNDSGLAVAGAVVVVAAPTFVALLADSDASPHGAVPSGDDTAGRS